MDITAFAKILVEGSDAENLMRRLVANRLPSRPGGIALAHMLNPAGRIELEVTLVRFPENRDTGSRAFYLVCAAFLERRLLDHIDRHRGQANVKVTSLSDNWAALALNGPRARDVLRTCTDADLSNAGFPWLSAQRIKVAGHRVWALRMSYAGELGWELHIPNDSALAVYDALWTAGERHGIADYGSFAMNALRMEKAFKGAGELTNEVTLPEADLMRFARSEFGYMGRERTLAQRPRWKCAYLEIEPDGVEDGHGGEAVLLNGTVVGSISSVTYGHCVDRILAFAYLKPEAARAGTGLDAILAGRARPARVLDLPVHDPESLRPRVDETVNPEAMP